jgi:hypothetical protein
MPGDFVKDFRLNQLDLTTCKGETINLRFVLVELSVFETIWSNQITCDLFVNDANNLIMNLPILGFEDLSLSFETPGGGTWIKKMRLMRITDRRLTRERELGYILHFVTPEAITNMKTRVSKSYKGKLISDIVNDLHYNWLGGGAAEIETTKFQHHIIIPKIFPVHAINWLCTRANSATYEGANYLYYQDKDKFRFVSMESRLIQPAAKKYLFQVANVRKDTADGYKPRDLAQDVLAAEVYTFDNHLDILDNLRAGMYGNELYVHSQQRKLWKDFTFDYPSSFDTYKHLYPSNYLESRARQDLNVPDSKLKLHGDGRPSEYPFLPEKWIPARISQLQQLANIRLTITVPGDSDRKCGEVVEFILPSPEPPLHNQQIDDKYYKGRFLIAAVRHKIDVDKYVTVLELIKDSVFTAFP